MKEIIHTCDHIGIFTNNSKKLANFYTKKLGFKKSKEEILDKSIFRTIFDIADDCKFIRLLSGNIMVEIFEPVSTRVHKGIKNIRGYNHWGYCVADKEKSVQKLRRKRVKIIQVKRNDHVVYFITDPDGNRIEIRECSSKRS